MIVRSVIWRSTFYCCYGGNIVTPKPSVYDKRQFVDTFDYYPSESLTLWAERVAYDKTQEMGQESCSELSEEFSVCNIDIEVLSTEEIDTEKVEVPDNIIELIKHYLEKILESLDEISIFQDRINAVEQEYNFNLEDFEPLNELNKQIKKAINDVKKEQQNL